MCTLESGCCCLFVPLFFIFLSLQFSNIKIFRHFSPELWGLEGWNLLHTWKMGGCIVYTRIMLLLLFLAFFSFFFLSSFQTFSSHFSQELWGLEDWNLVHMWADVSCIPKSGCCCIFVPLFLHFSFSPIFKYWNFSSHFSQELWGLEGWNLVYTWTVGRCIVYTWIRLLLLIRPFSFHLSFSSDSAIAGLYSDPLTALVYSDLQVFLYLSAAVKW